MTVRPALVRRTVAVVVLVGAVGVLAAPLFRVPAATTLSSWPADGTALSTGPGVVRLTVPSTPSAGGVHVTVVDAAGTAVVAGPPRIEHDEVVQPMRHLEPGTYRIAYHIEFADRAAATGSAAFGVGQASVAPAGLDDDEARDIAGAPAVGVHQHDPGSVDPLTMAALGANVIVLLGIAVLEIRRRRRS